MLTNENVLVDAIRHYGTEAQTSVCIEEMAELSHAILKYRRYPGGSDECLFRAAIVEEIADVEIMLAQLRIIYGIEEYSIAIEKEFKLKRLAERIAKEKELATLHEPVNRKGENSGQT